MSFQIKIHVIMSLNTTGIVVSFHHASKSEKIKDEDLRHETSEVF